MQALPRKLGELCADLEAGMGFVLAHPTPEGSEGWGTQRMRRRWSWTRVVATLMLTGSVAVAQQSATDAPPAAAAAPEVAGPIAIVPLDSSNADAAAKVTGALTVSAGKAIIAASGTVTSGSATTTVTLPHRGVLRVCAATTVKLAADAGVPAGEVPGLLMAMEQGAIEASFATGRDSDILMTPDFRILITGPGAADVKVRLGQHGDTCVDNAGLNAPYVLVSSVFSGGAYRVQAGQRVMFQHGKLNEVVDQEKEPCGCPPDAKAPNEFPLAQSEGLAPLAPPAPAATGAPGQVTTALSYNGADKATQAETATNPSTAPIAPPTAPPTPPRREKKPSFLGRVGSFFKKIFGAE